jgi:hypothetical protein
MKKIGGDQECNGEKSKEGWNRTVESCMDVSPDNHKQKKKTDEQGQT